MRKVFCALKKSIEKRLKMQEKWDLKKIEKNCKKVVDRKEVIW